MTILFLIGFLGCGIVGFPQNIARVVEYKPAPGQHINIENIGTPQAAQNMAENETSLVSLGSFGGFVLLKFDAPCQNDPDNPYGVDFTIFGNAFSGSSEPGVVWVMKDENENGEPDDKWYEIAGSHHYYSRTQQNVRVSYFKTNTRDVRWNDNLGGAGVIKANNYNAQDYYPGPEIFPDYPKDSVTFQETRLLPQIDFSDPQKISVNALDFGYADNRPKKQGVDLTIPDNPYSKKVEGAGGDAIDISWAVDAQNNYVELDEIHFVKIATGYLAGLGRLGEASTDVSFVVDVEPNAASSGKENLLVVYNPPYKMLVGDTLVLESGYFSAGRLVAAQKNYNVVNTEVVTLDGAGRLIAKKTGTSEIEVAAMGEKKIFPVEVTEPDSISITASLSSVYPGDTVLLNTQVFDKTDELIFVRTAFSTSDLNKGEVIKLQGNWYLVAKQAGEIVITCKVHGFGLQKELPVRILSPSDRLSIYFSIKTENENLFPLQWIEVGLSDLNSVVDNPSTDQSAPSKITVAHVLKAGLQQAGLNFTFRDDEHSDGKLYLYSVENKGLFTYGWGGKTEPAAFARAWIAKKNSTHFLNGFDKLEVASGDTLFLYHISDITVPWKFSRLLTNKSNAKSGEKIELKSEETNCNFTGDSISETGFYPLINRQITGNETVFTNESGEAEFIWGTDTSVVYASGNDAALVQTQKTTTVHFNATPIFKIYPNPVSEILHISGNGLANSDVKIVTVGGEILLSHRATSNSEKLNISHLKPGFYFLVVEKNGLAETTKFVRK